MIIKDQADFSVQNLTKKNGTKLGVFGWGYPFRICTRYSISGRIIDGHMLPVWYSAEGCWTQGPCQRRLVAEVTKFIIDLPSDTSEIGCLLTREFNLLAHSFHLIRNRISIDLKIQFHQYIMH
jgi:hypothetical protein